MTDPQKTVFISYRRKVSFGIARAIFMDLRANGYDAFMDVANIDAGKFDTIILNQIAARAHFLVILEPGTLDRCLEPGDWLRREIEYAMDLERNIVPVMVESFRFDDQMHQYLTSKLNELPRYNGLHLYHDYFEDGMRKLRDRFLKQPVYVPISPTPRKEEAVVQQKIEEVVEQPEPEEKLSTEEYFKRGNDLYEQGDLDGAIADYNDALRLNPRYAEAYNNRGNARKAQGDLDGAIADYNDALRLNPQYADAYVNRGLARYSQGDYAGAIADYTEALRLNPQYADAYVNRGQARIALRDYAGAMADCNEAIRLNPQYAAAYNNRGISRKAQGDVAGAIADYTEALRLNPQFAIAYNNRGNARTVQGDVAGAIADYTEAIWLNPQYALPYNNRGAAYENKGDYELALADYDAALRIDPQHELARNNRAKLLKKMKRK